MRRVIISFAIALLLVGCDKSVETTLTSATFADSCGTSTMWFSYPVAQSNSQAVADSINSAVLKALMADQMPPFEAYKVEAAEYNRDSITYYQGSSWSGCRSKEVISIMVAHEMYTGGAHGGVLLYSLNFDARSGKQIDIKSVIADTAAFRRRFIESYVRENELDINRSADETGYFIELNELPIPNILCFTETGIQGWYGQYDIACYAVGITSATVRYEDLHGNLMMDLGEVKEIEVAQ